MRNFRPSKKPDHNGRAWDTACGKYRYFSLSRARYYQEQGENYGTVDLRIYECPNGKGWHLTSKGDNSGA